MSNNTTPRYGQIIVHENAAGLAYCRFLNVCDDDPRKFVGRVIDPTTMRVVRWTEQDVTDGRCVDAAVGIPVSCWGWLHAIKFAGNVAEAKEFWNSVHWGSVINMDTADV